MKRPVSEGLLHGSPRRRAWLAAGAWAGAIFVVSSLPELPDVGPELPFLDKLLHFGEYAVFGLLLRRAFLREGGHAGAHAGTWALAAAVVYGALDEAHQAFVPGRVAELGDLAADACGAAAAQLAMLLRK